MKRRSPAIALLPLFALLPLRALGACGAFMARGSGVAGEDEKEEGHGRYSGEGGA